MFKIVRHGFSFILIAALSAIPFSFVACANGRQASNPPAKAPGNTEQSMTLKGKTFRGQGLALTESRITGMSLSPDDDPCVCNGGDKCCCPGTCCNTPGTCCCDIP